MLIFGKNVFLELDGKYNLIKKIYLSDNFHDPKIFDIIKNNKLNYEKLTNQKMNQMINANHQGIIIDMVDYQYVDYDKIIESDFIVMLDHIEDPHNLGAIIRTCEAAGVKSIIIPKDRAVGINGTVMKISSGALANVNIHQVSNLINTIDKLKKDNYFIYGADMEGTNYLEVDYANKKVIIIGNEGSGISKLVKENCDEIIKIKMQGKINSLNASVAAGIIIFGLIKE